jgi:hypothetical protein
MDANNKNWAANVASNMPLDQLLAQLAQASPATTRPMPTSATGKLPQLHVGRGTRYANLQWFPVWTNAPVEPRGYVTNFDSAQVKVAERDQASVGGLKIANTTGQPVLLFEGTLLEGGWQHRALTRSVLVPAASEIDLPVVCVEHGRWGGVAHQVVGKKMATAGMRASMRGLRKEGTAVSQNFADQGEVWSKVDRLAFELNQHAPTQSFVEMRNELDKRMQLEQVEPLAGQRGVIIAIGGHPVALELFDHPDTLAERIDSIVQSYVAESMVRPFIAAHGSRIRSFVDRIERETLGEKVDDNRKRTKPNAHVASEALFERDVMLHLSTLNVKHELVLAA